MTEPNAVSFFVPGKPSTKNNKRAFVVGGKARVVIASKDRARMASFSAVAAEHALAVPLRGPVHLSLRFVFVPPKSMPVWKRVRLAALAADVPKVTKPDLSRLVTFAEDCLSGIFFVDDNQVIKIAATKEYGDRPGTWVKIVPAPVRQRDGRTTAEGVRP